MTQQNIKKAHTTSLRLR